MHESSGLPFNRLRQFLPQPTAGAASSRLASKFSRSMGAASFRGGDRSVLLLPTELLDQLSRTLPMASAWPREICETLWRERNPLSQARRFEICLRQEPALCREFLRLANCEPFAPALPVVSIRDALNRLGSPACLALVALAGTMALFDHNPCHEEWVRDQKWRSNLRAALLSRRFCQKLQWPECELAFTAALLHNVGALLLMPNDSHELPAEVDFPQTPHGDCQAALSAWFCLCQGLPPGVVGAVRWQQRPELAGEHCRRATLIGAATATVAEERSPAPASSIGAALGATGIADAGEILSRLWRENSATFSASADELAGG